MRRSELVRQVPGNRTGQRLREAHQLMNAMLCSEARALRGQEWLTGLWVGALWRSGAGFGRGCKAGRVASAVVVGCASDSEAPTAVFFR